MCPTVIVPIHPDVQILLELLHRQVDLFPEGDAVELVLDGLVEPLTDPVGLGMPGLGLRVVDVVKGQKQLVVVSVRLAAVLGSPVCQDAQNRSTLLIEEWQNPVVEQIRCGDGLLGGVQFGESGL